MALLLSQVHLKNFMPQFLLKELATVFASAEQEVASTGWKDWHKRTAILPTSMPLLAPKLSAEVMEDHIRNHVADPDTDTDPERAKGAAELIEVVRTYLK